jgi:hypothetical protein
VFEREGGEVELTYDRPECMEKGRHMMVWVWSFGGEKRFSTCFDVMIE